MTIIEQLKQARKESGLTQKQLAAKAGITHDAISDIENKKRNPGSEILEKLAKAFNKEWRLIDIKNKDD